MRSRTLIPLLASSLLVGCASVPPAIGVPASGPLAVGQHEPTLNGVRMWYRVAGRASGVPVVFIAGGPGGNHYEFATLAGPSLEPSHRMVYFDGRGTGRSERPASGDYRIATLAEDLNALRRHLGVPRIAIIAHSFAAIPALEYAAKYPDGAAALVIAGGLWNAPASCREGAERKADAATAAEDRARLATIAALPDDQICGAGSRGVPRQERERARNAEMFPISSTLDKQAAAQAASGLKNTGELSSAVFREGLLSYRFAKLDQVRAPVLVVSGTKDLAAGPKTQRALAAALPNGRLIEYPNYGHWMFIDDPARFGRDISRFLRNAR